MRNRHFAVIGDPISHSLSPLLHQTGFNICYKDCGLSYAAYQVPKEALAHFLRMFRGEVENTFTTIGGMLYANDSFFEGNDFPQTPSLFLSKQDVDKNNTLKFTRGIIPFGSEFEMQSISNPKTLFQPMGGLSVTLPHKKEIMQYADRVTPLARLAGAANTLYWDKNGELVAENTDIAGFLSPLERVKNPLKSAIILGAGGAAAAVVVGLLQVASIKEIYVCARNEAQAHDLIDHIKNASVNKNMVSENIDVQKLNSLQYLPFEEREKIVDLVVNTIPASLGGQSFTPRTNFKNVSIAYDLLYAQTPFLVTAQKQGIQIITGKEMFLEQGTRQFALWTGKRIPIEAFNAVESVMTKK